MPTYEYTCRTCGEQLEAVQAFTDDALTVCPNCGGELRKVFGSVGIVFKGSGFYKTDSRGTTASTKPADGDSSSSGTPAADTKSTTTPAAEPAKTTPAPATPAPAASPST
jgi:putative FmdB family regulatory protein